MYLALLGIEFVTYMYLFIQMWFNGFRFLKDYSFVYWAWFLDIDIFDFNIVIGYRWMGQGSSILVSTWFDISKAVLNGHYLSSNEIHYVDRGIRQSSSIIDNSHCLYCH